MGTEGKSKRPKDLLGALAQGLPRWRFVLKSDYSYLEKAVEYRAEAELGDARGHRLQVLTLTGGRHLTPRKALEALVMEMQGFSRGDLSADEQLAVAKLAGELRPKATAKEAPDA